MLLTEFPDIRWLRKQARTSFQDQKGVNNQPLPSKGWPNVVLKTTASFAERSNILAPFSLFMNVSGSSTVIADRREVQLEEDTFCIVNKGQVYDLLLNNKQSTTTFNIHFGDQLFQETLHAISHNSRQLLDHPDPKGSGSFLTFTRSRWKDQSLRYMIQQLQLHYQNREENLFAGEEEYELLSQTLHLAFQNVQSDQQGLLQLDALRKSTKEELVRRLNRSVDYIHDFYWKKVSLDELSQVACLSKYHYLRSFKQLFSCAPHQYLMKVRLQKAEHLLRHTPLPLAEIALQLGFEEYNSFGRFFRKYHSCTPLAFRMGGKN